MEREEVETWTCNGCEVSFFPATKYRVVWGWRSIKVGDQWKPGRARLCAYCNAAHEKWQPRSER